MGRIILFAVCFFSLVPYLCAGQNTDFEFWPSAELRYNASKKFRFSVEQQLRLDNNASQFKSTFTEAGLKYRLSDYFGVRANYRFIIKPNDIEQRISGDILARYQNKKFPLRLNYRVSFQKTYMGAGKGPENFLRNKIQISYNLSKVVDPFIAGELYYRIWNKPNEFQKYRLDAGLEWRLSKQSDLAVFYRLQKELNVNNPATVHVIGMGYSVTIN